MKILFVCSGNTCRSPMAQALLLIALKEKKSNLASDLAVLSAGIFTYDGARPSQEAVEAMLQYKIDLSGHRALLLSSSLVDDADLILTMARSQCTLLRDKYPEKEHCIFLLSEFVDQGDKDVEDPFGMGLNVYVRTAGQIQALVQILIEKLANS